MRFARRLVRWLLFLGFFLAVGAGVFFFVRSRPRCTINQAGDVALLSPDGSQLLTSHTGKTRGGKLQVWDTHDGRLLREWTSKRDGQFIAHSSDGRHYASFLEDGPLRLIEWQTGQLWTFDEPKHVNSLTFSPNGRWLFVMTSMGDPNYLIDVRSRKIVDRPRDMWPTFSADGRFLFLRKQVASLTKWDLEANQALGSLALTSPHYRVSPDGSVLVELHVEPVPEPDEEPGDVRIRFGGGMRKIERKDYRIDVWDAATFKHRFHYQVAHPGDLHAALSPDGRRLALWLREDDRQTAFEMVDTITGKRLWSFEIRHRTECVFSPDGALVFLCHQVGALSYVSMFDAETGKALWRRLGSGLSYFANDTGLFLHQDNDSRPFLLLDVHTGECRGILPADFLTANHIPIFTADEQSFVIRGWQQRARAPVFWEVWLDKHWPRFLDNDATGVLVIDTATARERFRGIHCGERSATLSADGSTLVTVDPWDDREDLALIRVWDVQATKAWLWALGVALAAASMAGFAVVLVRLLRNRSRSSVSHLSTKISSKKQALPPSA